MTTPTNAPLDATQEVREMIEELTTIARDLREANATLDRILRDKTAEHGAKTAGRKKRRIEAGENRLRDHFGGDDLE